AVPFSTGSFIDIDRASGAFSYAADHAASIALGNSYGFSSLSGAERSLRFGTSLPVIVYRRSAPHRYDITTAVAVNITRNADVQNPMTLCQLKLRAFPRSPLRNHSTGFTLFKLIFRGNHRY